MSPYSFSHLVGAAHESFSQPFGRRFAVGTADLGGDEGNRTLDPLLAGQVLSQLSYTPISLGIRFVGSEVPQN